MSARYFIRVRGDVQGPFDEDRLWRLAQRGHFSRSHEVSTDGLTWSRAAEFPDLFPPPPAPKFRRSGGTADDGSVWIDDADFVGGISDGQDQPDATWFYIQNTEQKGPHTFENLQLLADNGVLKRDDLVWKEGFPDWVRAELVPGLIETTPGRSTRVMLVAGLAGLVGLVGLAAVVWLLRSLW